MKTALTLVYLCVVAAYLLDLARVRAVLLHPGLFFLLGQVVGFLGTVPLLELEQRADIAYLLIMLCSLCCFVLGGLLARSLLARPPAAVRAWSNAPVSVVEDTPVFNAALFGIVAVSVAISWLYYRAVGYNFFVMGIGLLFSGGSFTGDVADLRLYAYAGDRYFAPGYVNQFKNVLLPLATAFIAARGMLLGRRRDLILAVALIPLTVIFLVGTGQRYALFIAALMVAVYFTAALPAERAFRINTAIGATVVLLFLCSSLFLGRTVSTLGGAADFGLLMREMWERFAMGNQLGGLVGFRYVHAGQPVWGLDWGQQLATILPSQGGSSIANEIHAALYASGRGTVPLLLSGSAWYNFGLSGVVLTPLFVGLLCEGIFRRMINGPKTLFRVLIYAAASVIIGSWTSGGPLYLMTGGLVTVALLSFAGKQIARYWSTPITGRLA